MRIFADKLSDIFPQQSPAGDVQYVLGGSIGTALAVTARELRVLDTATFPGVRLAETIPLSPRARSAGLAFTRQAGDIDVALTAAYRSNDTGLNWNSGWVGASEKIGVPGPGKQGSCRKCLQTPGE